MEVTAGTEGAAGGTRCGEEVEGEEGRMLWRWGSAVRGPEISGERPRAPRARRWDEGAANWENWVN